MNVVKVQDFEVFRLTKENSIDNSDWPQWMHEAWNKELHELYHLTRRSSIYSGAGPYELALCIADCYIVVEPGDYIRRDRRGRLHVICDLECSANYLGGSSTEISKKLRKLEALECCGVDNWSGYSDAMLAMELNNG